MSGYNDHYSNQDRDRGRGRERSRDSDRRGGSDRSRSRYDEGRRYDDRGYDDDRRPRGDSYDRRSGSYGRNDSYQDRGGYDRRMMDDANRQGQYRRHSGGGHYGPQANGHGGGDPRGYSNRRGDVDSPYGPGSQHGRAPYGDRRNSDGRGPPRGGRYGGGGSRYGGGRGRGGGRGQGPDLSGIQDCTTNILQAEVTEGFHFFEYTVNAENSSGEVLESRKRRAFLFHLGLFDGLLKDLSKKEKDNFRKVVFFNGSTFYSGRPIPGLDASNLPYDMDFRDRREGKDFRDRGEGDTMQIGDVRKLLAPKDLQVVPKQDENPNEVRFDNRTANGTMSFQNQQALLQHCQQTGDEPAYVPSDGVPASLQEFSAFINSALQSALGERLSKWGRDLVNPNKVTRPRGLGVSVYEAFRCTFSVLKKPEEENKAAEGLDFTVDPKVILHDESVLNGKKPGVLALTVDLGAKVLRDRSVLNELVGGKEEPDSDAEKLAADSWNPTEEEKNSAKKKWEGQIVITKHDKRCYSVVGLDFENSAESLEIENLGMNHAEYFAQRKDKTLRCPKFKPMVAVLGRRDQIIHLPAEMVCGNELEQTIKERLPMIANFPPGKRHEAIGKAIEFCQGFLIPGARGTQGILPGLGIQITDKRFSSRARVLPLPMVMAAGLQIPEAKKNMWAPELNRRNYNINPRDSNTFNVVLIHNDNLELSDVRKVYSNICWRVNKLNTLYRLSDKPFRIVKAGSREWHWQAVEKCFADASSLPTENVFVIDFCKPGGSTDPAYPVIKHMLTSHGYISQFVNFSKCPHDRAIGEMKKRSGDILNGVGRQILWKAGARLWWVKIPQGLPTPSVFVGVDVFHAPKEYDPVQKRRVRKRSCASIIVQIFRDQPDRQATVELYSETVAREAGMEYDLRDSLNGAVKNALKELEVDPMSCVVWRDGIGDSAFESEASQEIEGVEEALKDMSLNKSKKTPLAYVVCQKRIDTKLFAKGVNGHTDGTLAAPPGTLVQGIQALKHNTFYINGRAPRDSTPKPVRYVVVRQDDELEGVSLPELTWNMCHDYPNWTGPIKVPSVCMMAHKLAELAGNMADSGQNMNNKALKNRVHFL
eukprot:CAMPEP_0113606254 /NCGR_PEP_ID=MMETSP0017_2-20120614/2758_1 /TAXON_ID=2856 /ORGANISM="Cylindrotheca closterium" /LENGTH=1098 /DNA_ID=CAMNT_0000514789 /DNA_START=150 /DNA_END=3446 /DNA_ORIENTATION=- /assembly_acc=CAM_ASM_000147